MRIQGSLLAPLEKRCLIWMAERLPRPINSDHLTALAAVSMLAAGFCYWSGSAAALIAAIVLLAVNWFGDSLDGTLARVRRHERPRYGFYVDHVLDVLCILFIFAGLVLGGHMSPMMGAGFLLAYYLLMIEIALATHAVGTFRISFWKFGPTELRILLAIGTLQLDAVRHGDDRRLESPAVRRGRSSGDRRARDHLRGLRGRQHASPVSRRAAATSVHARRRKAHDFAATRVPLNPCLSNTESSARR